MKCDAVSKSCLRSVAVSFIRAGSRYTHAGRSKSGVLFDSPVFPTAIAPALAAPTTVSDPTPQSSRRRNRGDESRPRIGRELASGAVVRRAVRHRRRRPRRPRVHEPLPVALDEIHDEELAAYLDARLRKQRDLDLRLVRIREVDLHRGVLDRVDWIRDDGDVARVPGLQRLPL